MNNYNLYFSPNNKTQTKTDNNLRLNPQPPQRTKWSTLFDSTDSKQKPHNNYFRYKNNHEDPSNKLSFNNDMILARSMSYDFKFKTDFVDSKLNLAAALAKTGITNNEKKATTGLSLMKKVEAIKPEVIADEPETIEVENIFKKDTEHKQDQFILVEAPKLTDDEELLVVKSKQKCEEWFEKHFNTRSNTSSPMTDRNDF